MDEHTHAKTAALLYLRCKSAGENLKNMPVGTKLLYLHSPTLPSDQPAHHKTANRKSAREVLENTSVETKLLYPHSVSFPLPLRKSANLRNPPVGTKLLYPYSAPNQNELFDASSITTINLSLTNGTYSQTT